MHYLSATRIDVLHSPFVFELYNSCIARQKPTPEYTKIEHLRKQVSGNSELIVQNDHGALSAHSTTRTKTIRSLLRTDVNSSRMAFVLSRIIQFTKSKNALELGTSLGFTTAYIAQALPTNGIFYSIEGASQLIQKAQQHLKTLHLADKVRLLEGTFEDLLPKTLETIGTLDFAFIDGNHTYEATMAHFETLKAYTHNNSVLVFDDIYWSKGMTQAWEEIKKDPQVSVTVDLYFMGLVFFRREQLREHFKLRIW